MIRNLAAIVLTALLLTGCWDEPETGPVEIIYGRDSGTFCKMIISDPRFAAEIREGKGKKVYKFDDIGDAIHWLKGVTWKQTPETEFWVMDMATGKKWLDARKVWYLPGQHSPMEYGYGAMSEQSAGTISFSDMRKAVLARGATSRCETPNHPDEPHAHDDGQIKQ